jgi:trans-aconitate methyltransferase
MWNAKLYDDRHSFVWKFGASLVELLAPQASEAVLDLGCGTGHLTAQIAAAGASVLGIDSSPQMIEEARRSHPGIRFEVQDARSLEYVDQFDAVFSNAALHWMHPPEAVLAGIARALKPGGRFIAEMGGHNNTAAILTAFRAVLAKRGIEALDHMPWYFPSAAAYQAKLEAAGFRVEEIAIIPRPTPLAAGLAAWLDTFCEDFFLPLTPPDRTTAKQEVIDLLEPILMDETGLWIADYVRLRFRAVLAE